MKTINLTNPEQIPTDGDQIKIIYDNGMTETKYFWTPFEESIPEPIFKNILTPLEFLNRFSDVEIKTIMALSKTDPDVELWWLRYNKAQEMDLDDPQTIAGVNALEQVTIIAIGRALEILTKYPL